MPDLRLLDLSLSEVADRIRRAELSPVELAEAVLARIAAYNPTLNAYTTLVPPAVVLDAARAAEREIAGGAWRGPLHGVPAGVKDLIDTAGLRTTYGSGMFTDHVPARDGAIPERLRAAGAIVVGKTATHELGKGITTNNYFFGATRNPWNLAHVPGGSSGGSAAALAAGMGPLQIGTDGGGSIRIPAAFCGLVGYKPTRGLLSNRGQFGNGNVSYSVPGPLARTVRDAALIVQALAGFDPEYVFSRPEPPPDLLATLDAGVRGLRVGVSPDFLAIELDAPVRAAYEATLARLGALGAQVVEVRMPHHGLVMRTIGVAFATEGDTQLAALAGDRPRVFGPQVTQMHQASRAADVALCVRALQDRASIEQDYAAAFLAADVLVLPTVPTTAFRIDADETSDMLRCVTYTGAANLAGLPAVALPAGFAGGLPVSVQVCAPAGADALVLRVAAALEQAAPEHRVRLPALG
jgi:aspartyl-tRNA(Asn)/glutamyl-tRNA(Gln) amidotransferase subunit A